MCRRITCALALGLLSVPRAAYALASAPPLATQQPKPQQAPRQQQATEPQLPADDASDTVRAAEATPRMASGRIVHPVGERTLPLSSIWVVLHRVGPDRQGPLDSTRTNASGAYSLRYRPSGRHDAIYFLSVRYDGIAYFSPPLRSNVVRGADGEITVYDTTSALVPLHVRGRHLIVSAPRVTGDREIVEVFELSNDTSVTAISPDDHRETWSVMLPPGATDFRVGDGDVPPDAIRFEGGRVIATAPFAPGLKQVSFAYRLPATGFPLSVPIVHGADVLEVLLEEPTASVAGAKLAPDKPVAVEGRTFRRFVAQNVPANAAMRIEVPSFIAPGRRSLYIALIATSVGAALLIGLAVSTGRRKRKDSPPSSARPAIDEADALAQRIAELDAEFEREATTATSERRAQHDAQRAALKQRLASMLASRRTRA